MALFSGRSLPISPPRRLIADFVRVSQKLPLVSLERHMELGPLRQARDSSRVRPSWAALLTRAFALLAERRPVLRRSYLRFPWPRLHEHPESVAAIVVEREFEGEVAPLFATLRAPEKRPLGEIHEWVRACQTLPLQRIGAFRRALRQARLPLPLRHLSMWLGTEWFGTVRAQFFGTFGLTLTAPFGATSLNLLAPWTTTMTTGMFDAQGIMPLRVWFDHRVHDGAGMARLLAELETILLKDILEEIRSFHR